MLELLSSGVISLWLDMAGVNRTSMNAVRLLAWQSGLPGLFLPDASDPTAMALAQKYLKQLRAKGLINQNVQGIWLQSGTNQLVNLAGKKPLPGASLTKVATSLAALQTWGHDYQFVTEIRSTGKVIKGVLKGDLIIVAGGDPWLIWQEGIEIGNSLEKMGVQRVEGNMIIVGNFGMNFSLDPQISGELLRQAIDAGLWTREIQEVYDKMVRGTRKPRVEVMGLVKTTKISPNSELLLSHKSVPLVAILKEMNVHSDNEMAEMLANNLGGARVVEQQVEWIAGIPSQEISLKNGSGLGEDNIISPRAVCLMLMSIQRYLQNFSLNLADVFPVSGRDQGTLLGRAIPQGSVVKTGTLDNVIALAGVIPTRDKGLVWFTIIHRGMAWGELRYQQDLFLQELVKIWGKPTAVSSAIIPHDLDKKTVLGMSSRNAINNLSNY